MSPAIEKDTWSPAATNILLALYETYVDEGRCTVRAVARRAGRSTAATFDALKRLKRAGLVAFEAGSKGTLRPLVRCEPIEPNRTTGGA
jgi:DNA-binding IscR family transcriptional regulator